MLKGRAAPQALTHVRVITPETEIADSTVIFAEGRILHAGVGPPPDDVPAWDLRGFTIAPGFIDLHTHGGGGFSLAEGDPEQIRGYSRWAANSGVTGFLVTLLPDRRRRLVKHMESAAGGCEGATGGARPLGINLEGPFLSPLRCGALDPNVLRPADVAELREHLLAARGLFRIMTIAPELPGAPAVIAEAIGSGVTVALGHSDATYDEAMRAFALGVRHVTHCFNAMRPFHQRKPGCLAAALLADDVTAELIADGVHVNPAAMEMLLRLKGVDRTVLVTDAILLAGMGDGAFELQGARVEVKEGVARRDDGQFAGSTATMDAMVRNAARWLPVNEAEAIRMATLNPATVIGVADRKGRIAPGYDADLVVLSPDLRVEMTFVAGELVYERQPSALRRSTNSTT
jgi:N-acetylglucosamine-6-phosphate deacetylase